MHQAPFGPSEEAVCLCNIAGGPQKPVEYFTSQVEAEIFAADYNKVHRHTSLAGHRETLAEVYCRWQAAHIADTEPSASTIASYTNSWRHLEPLGPEPIAELKHRDYQGILDRMRKDGLSYSSLKKVRSLISLVEKYALETEIISRLMRLSSGSVKPPGPPAQGHQSSKDQSALGS